MLLPRRVVAYAFRQRKFFMLDIQALKTIPNTQSAFRDLKIDPSHKSMVRSLVEIHLQKQAAQKSGSTPSLNQDLIRGKGSGLVMLLHGVPGVGKTATAEAVAQANKKPLFPITCGDLGFTPREVEDTLREIFRLAHHWDCVLLLDEADIFLSSRQLSDLKRNALVSGTAEKILALQSRPTANIALLNPSISPSSRILQRNFVPHNQPGWSPRRSLQIAHSCQLLLSTP